MGCSSYRINISEEELLKAKELCVTEGGISYATFKEKLFQGETIVTSYCNNGKIISFEFKYPYIKK